MGMIVRTIFDFYIYVVIIRCLLPFAHIDYYNPIVQLVMKATDPIVMPLRKYVANIQRIDTASVIIAVVLKIVELSLLLLFAGFSLNLIGVFVWSLGELLSAVITVYFGSIVIQAILSWISIGPEYVASLMISFNEPLLGIARRYIPPFNSLDLSPLAVLILLQLVNMLIATPISHVGLTLIR